MSSDDVVCKAITSTKVLISVYLSGTVTILPKGERLDFFGKYQIRGMAKMRCAVFFAACVAAGTGSAPAPAGPLGPKTPHVVYFLVDDLGNANVGFHNDEPITPTIDALARNGAILDRFYTYKFCSPTRSSFLSGRLPVHVNQINHPPEVPGGGVPPEMSTIADVLKGAGYRSHQIGKWHGGMSRAEQLPVNRGFESSFGYLSGAEDHFDQTRDGYHDFWRNLKPAHNETGAPLTQCQNSSYLGDHDCRYATYQYTAEAERIIAAHPDPAKNPLMLYMCFGAMHGPLQAPQKYIDMYPNVSYAPRQKALAMISIVDDAIANVTNALHAACMWDDTLIIFSSDK